MYKRQVLGDGKPPIVYNVEAMRIMQQAGVQSIPPAPESFTFSAMPNPSPGNIAIEISGPDHADIEIFNTLGKLVTSQKNISTWTWNGLAANGAPAPTGNYFIRATTRDASGKIIVTTKQVVIVR